MLSGLKRGTPRRYLIIGVVLLLTGAATRFLNYERRTTAVAENVEGVEILEYEAPGWDPFPHTVRITVRTGDAVMIVGTYSGAKMQTERFGLRDGEERLLILPNESLRLTLENPASTSGEVKTVLWCDSWNYAAYAQLSTGLVLLGIATVRARK